VRFVLLVQTILVFFGGQRERGKKVPKKKDLTLNNPHPLFLLGGESTTWVFFGGFVWCWKQFPPPQIRKKFFCKSNSPVCLKRITNKTKGKQEGGTADFWEGGPTLLKTNFLPHMRIWEKRPPPTRGGKGGENPGPPTARIKNFEPSNTPPRNKVDSGGAVKGVGWQKRCVVKLLPLIW